MDNHPDCADNTAGHGCAGVLRAQRFCDPGQDEVEMIKVGVVGGTGYTGVELLRLLALHPEVQLQAVTSRGEAGTGVADMFPNLRGYLDLAFSEPDVSILAACDLVFFATPNGIAMGMAPALLDRGVRVIDLAADFRTAFGDVKPRVTGIAIAADTDQTGETVTAWFGDIRIGN